jgi:hypothetical protein
LQDPISKKKKKKNLYKKRTGGVAQGVSPEFKHQNCKKRKRKKRVSRVQNQPWLQRETPSHTYIQFLTPQNKYRGIPA